MTFRSPTVYSKLHATTTLTLKHIYLDKQPFQNLHIVLSNKLSSSECCLFHLLNELIDSVRKEFASDGHFQFIKRIFQRTIRIQNVYFF
jgi:hypothetical protein